MPPWAEPVSPNLDPIAHESGNALGLEIGKYLTADGYKGVQHSMGTQNSYGIMFSADVATYTSWRGASLLLTETAGQRDLAYTYTGRNPLGPQGRSMDVPDPYRGTTWTLEQASEYAKAALYAGVRSVARNHEDWLLNTLYKTTSKSLSATDVPWAYVLPAGQRDPYAVYEMLRTLELADVEDRARDRAVHRRRQELPRGLLRAQDPAADGPLRQPDPRQRDVSAVGAAVRDLPADDALQRVHRQRADLLRADGGPGRGRVRRRDRAGGHGRAGAGAAAGRRRRRPAPTSSPPAPTASRRLLGSLQKWDVPTFRAGAAFSAGGKDYAPGTVIVPPTARARMVLDETAEGDRHRGQRRRHRCPTWRASSSSRARASA